MSRNAMNASEREYNRRLEHVEMTMAEVIANLRAELATATKIIEANAAEMTTIINERNEALAELATVIAQRDALRAVLQGAELMLGCASLGKPNYYVIRKSAIDAAIGSK